MKLNILLITLVVMIVAEVKGQEILMEVLELDQACRKESGLSKNDFQQLFNYRVTQPAKCYLKCAMRSFGVWNGGLDVDAIMAKVNKVPILGFISGKLKKMLNECTTASGSDECDKAFNTTLCLAGEVFKNYGDLIEKIYKAFRN